MIRASGQHMPLVFLRHLRHQEWFVFFHNLFGCAENISQDKLVLKDFRNGLHEECALLHAAQGFQVLRREQDCLRGLRSKN